MRVLAVPVKSLERSKSRLAPLLSPAERAALTLIMLEDVLEACFDQETWDVWLVSRDEAVLEVGAQRGARPLPEEGRSLLAAVRQVEAEIRGRSSELAVLLADLPLLTGEALARALAREEAIVAAPAGSDAGTNLLVRRPPAVIPARFGRASFAKHRWAARRARVAFSEVRLPELEFDLDRPTDLARVLASERSSRTRSACLEMRLPERLRLHA
jgi:2-phospho-L-lactate/phosphoenolpyruvate guanylyltransferase